VRYAGERAWQGITFADAGWPAQPQLGGGIDLDDGQIAALTSDVAAYFR
jgi:hypothetical protein